MSSSSDSSDPSDSESESNTSENNVLEVNSQEKKGQPDIGVTKKSADKDDNESPPQNSKSSIDKDKDSENTDSDESSEEESNSESMDKSIPNQPIAESQTKDTKQHENSDLNNNPSEKSDQNNSESEKESKSEKDPNKEEEHSEKVADKEQIQNEHGENDQNTQNQVTEPEEKHVKSEKSDKQIEEPSEKSSEPSQHDKKPDSEKEKPASEDKTHQKGEEQNQTAPISSKKAKKVSTDDSKASPESSTRKPKRKSQEESELDSSQSKKKSQKTSKSSERKSDTKETPKSSRSSKSPRSKDRGSNVGIKSTVDSDNAAKSDSRSEEQIEKEMEREDAEIEAVYQFNTHKNVQKLCSYFNAEETPEGIAHVIRTTKGLNGSIIGDYLGKKENSQILIAYFMELDLKCHFIEAMRRSLSGPMFMPGEGQIIDHIIQTFSDCYIHQNPQYKNPNELFVLSFALVMLNSDLHNPNNPRPMTEKQFIENTKHSLSSNDFTDKELAEMYNEIKAHEFLFTTHTNDFWWEVAPKIRGYLEKKSERAFSKWTKEFFVLTNSCLYYFKDDSPENAGNPLGVIQLTEVEVDADSKNPRFIRINAVHNEISYVKFRKIPKAVKGIKRITFKAPDRASASKWLHRLKKSAIMMNFLGDKMNDNNPPTNAKI